MKNKVLHIVAVITFALLLTLNFSVGNNNTMITLGGEDAMAFFGETKTCWSAGYPLVGAEYISCEDCVNHDDKLPYGPDGECEEGPVVD